MNWSDFHQAVRDAKNDVEKGDKAIEELGYLMKGRLRSSGVPCSVLEALKRELKDYNIHTMSWKEKS